MKNLFEVLDSKKGKIIKGALLAGGAILGAVVLAGTKSDDYVEIVDDGGDYEVEPENEEEVIEVEFEEVKE